MLAIFSLSLGKECRIFLDDRLSRGAKRRIVAFRITAEELSEKVSISHLFSAPIPVRVRSYHTNNFGSCRKLACNARTAVAPTRRDRSDRAIAEGPGGQGDRHQRPALGTTETLFCSNGWPAGLDYNPTGHYLNRTG